MKDAPLVLNSPEGRRLLRERTMAKFAQWPQLLVILGLCFFTGVWLFGWVQAVVGLVIYVPAVVGFVGWRQYLALKREAGARPPV